MFTVPANAMLNGKLGLIPNDQSGDTTIIVTVLVRCCLEKERKSV